MLFENFEIVDPIYFDGQPLNKTELDIIKRSNIMYHEWIKKDDGYYYVFNHRCSNIKDLPLMYIDYCCNEYKITNYTINDDYSIDINGDVNLSWLLHTKIPLKFNKVSGNFNCAWNQLTTLKGSPKMVGGHFYCQHNQLTTLDGGPEYVGGEFWCFDNKLTSTEYKGFIKGGLIT